MFSECIALSSTPVRSVDQLDLVALTAARNAMVGIGSQGPRCSSLCVKHSSVKCIHESRFLEFPTLQNKQPQLLKQACASNAALTFMRAGAADVTLVLHREIVHDAAVFGT